MEHSETSLQQSPANLLSFAAALSSRERFLSTRLVPIQANAAAHVACCIICCIICCTVCYSVVICCIFHAAHVVCCESCCVVVFGALGIAVRATHASLRVRCTAVMNCVASQRLWRSHRFRKKVDKIVEDKRRLRAYACQCGPTRYRVPPRACNLRRTKCNHATSGRAAGNIRRCDHVRSACALQQSAATERHLVQTVACGRMRCAWQAHAMCVTGACDMRGGRVRYAWRARAICVAGACNMRGWLVRAICVAGWCVRYAWLARASLRYCARFRTMFIVRQRQRQRKLVRAALCAEGIRL